MKKFLNVKEAAHAIGCSPATVRRMCKHGKLRALNLGVGSRANYRIFVDCIKSMHTARHVEQELPAADSLVTKYGG